jgi:hypothetical protein
MQGVGKTSQVSLFCPSTLWRFTLCVPDAQTPRLNHRVQEEVAPERTRISSCDHVPVGVAAFQEGTGVSNQAS